MKTFVIKQANKAGVYAFNVYYRGLPMVITVDDFVPVKDSKHLQYIDFGPDGSIWGALLEKAWVKVIGSYQQA